MRKDEQIDAMVFAVDNLIDELSTALDSKDEDAIGKFLGQLNYHVNHYIEEFDINLYEAVGILEDIKYTMLLEGEADPAAIGCLDAQKIALLSDDVVAFDCDMDEEGDFIN